MAAAPGSAKARRVGMLSSAQLRREVARAQTWCVVDRETGRVLAFEASRGLARERSRTRFKHRATAVVLADLRIAGQRA